MNFSKKIITWFDQNRRDLPWRRTRDIYKIWVSEVMLQQTRVDTVLDFYHGFLEQFPTMKDLAASSLQDVLKCWEGLGYYARARHLHQAAKLVMDEYQGHIPREPETFSRLPGVGPYICAAVMSIACGYSVPVVDGNVMRVITRWKGIRDDISSTGTRKRILRELENQIPTDKPGEFNEGLMELGALVCTLKAPACAGCPIGDECFAFRHNRVGEFPVKSPRAKAPQYDVSIGVIVKEGRMYIQQRPEKGHLGGLWEFPGGKALEGESAETALIRECREELGVLVEIIHQLAVVRHAYSHFKIHMTVFVCRTDAESIHTTQPHRWITADELTHYPFPTANHRFFPELRAWLDNVL